MMRAILGGVFGLGLAVLLVAAPASAETVAGKIQAVDSTGRMILLEDGTQLVLPATLNVSREQLREGAAVQVTYEVAGGQNVVRAIRVQPSPSTK